MRKGNKIYTFIIFYRDPDSFLLEWLPIVRALPSRGIISKEKCYNGFVQDALDIIKVRLHINMIDLYYPFLVFSNVFFNILIF